MISPHVEATSCALEMTLDGRPMEGMTVLEPFKHSVLEMALDGERIEVLSVLEPLEHSVLVVARNGRPMAGISVLAPLEHSVPEVTIVWVDCSLIRMTVSEPLEHSGLGVAIWRDVLCCVVRLSHMPVLLAMGYLRSFGGLGRTCIIDLNAGASTAPVEMLGDDTQTDFPRPQFLFSNVSYRFKWEKVGKSEKKWEKVANSA